MPGVYDYAAINRVQQANDIVDVIGEHVSLKKKGRELVGLCPSTRTTGRACTLTRSSRSSNALPAAPGRRTQVRPDARGTDVSAGDRATGRAGGHSVEAGPACAPQAPGEAEQVDPNLLARANAWAMQFFQQCLHDREKGKRGRTTWPSGKSPTKASRSGGSGWHPTRRRAGQSSGSEEGIAAGPASRRVLSSGPARTSSSIV